MSKPKSKSRNASRPSAAGTDLKIHYYWNQARRFGERYREFDWNSTEVILSFAHTYDVLWQHFSARMAEFGLSLAAFNTLMILASSEGGGCTQRDLSKLLLVSRANVTGLVDSLIHKGLVSRTTDRADRRVCHVRITAEGRRRLKALLPGHYREVRRVASGLGPSGTKQFTAFLEKIREQISLKGKS